MYKKDVKKMNEFFNIPNMISALPIQTFVSRILKIIIQFTCWTSAVKYNGQYWEHDL